MVFRATTTPEIVAGVKRLKEQGYGPAKISREMNISIGTVNGLLYRAKQPHGGKRTPASAKRAAADLTAWNRPGASVPPSPAKKVKARDPALDIDGKPFTFETVRPGLYQCRWIAGEPTAEAIICGHKTKPGEPYCAFHRDTAWQAARPAPPKHIPDRAIGQ